MSRRKSQACHPWLALRLLVNPLDRGVNRIGTAISPRSNVGRWHLLDRPILVVYCERRDIVPAERGEVDVAGCWIDARLVWIEDAASVTADTTGSFHPGLSHHCASVVTAVAGTAIRAAMVCVADEAA